MLPEHTSINYTSILLALNLRTFFCVLCCLQQQGASESAAVLFPQVLCQYGQWLADTHNASPTTIMQDYMEKVGWCSCALIVVFGIGRYEEDVGETYLLGRTKTLVSSGGCNTSFLYFLLVFDRRLSLCNASVTRHQLLPWR